MSKWYQTLHDQSVQCLQPRVKFNEKWEGFLLSKIQKFIYTQGEKQSGKVPERNFENSKLMRQILVVYFWYNIFTWTSNFWCLKFYVTIKACLHYFVFAIKRKLLKSYQKCFSLPKKLLLVLRFSNFCNFLYFTLPLFFPFLAIADFV